MILLTLKKHEAHTWEEQTPGLWGRRGGREEEKGGEERREGGGNPEALSSLGWLVLGC